MITITEILKDSPTAEVTDVKEERKIIKVAITWKYPVTRYYNGKPYEDFGYNTAWFIYPKEAHI